MRRIDYSGGLEFGAPDTGPWIDIIPLRKRTLSESELLDLAVQGLKEMFWTRLGDAPASQFAPKDLAGLFGYNEDVVIRLSHLKEERWDDLDALYAVERVDGPRIPPQLLSVLYVALAGVKKGVTAERLIFASQFMLMIVEMNSGKDHSYSRLNSREIDRLVGHLIEVPDLNKVLLPTGMVDRARFWMRLSQKLWHPEVIHRMAFSVFHSSKEYFDPIRLALATVASLYISLKQGKVDVRGVNMTTDTDLSLIFAWPQVLEWEAGQISQDALRWLSQGHFPDLDPPIDAVGFESNIDVLRANAAAEALLEEAKAHAVYAPSGQFRLRLPEDSPLAHWGVKYLRVWAEPDRLWVQFVGQGQGALGASVEWRPEHPTMLRPFLLPVSSGAVAAAHVTLAALWHDLVTAAEAALPEEGKEPGPRAVQAAQAREGARRRGSEAGRGRSYRALPRKKVRLRGRRDWSTEAERQRIMRRHRVSGHLRQLRAGWRASEEAQRWAKRYGFIVPRGYTFVRPHMRGSDERDVETVVVARGLETLMLLKVRSGVRSPGSGV